MGVVLLNANLDQQDPSLLLMVVMSTLILLSDISVVIIGYDMLSTSTSVIHWDVSYGVLRVISLVEASPCVR